MPKNHGQFIMDRNKKILKMLAKAKGSDAAKKELMTDPATFAATFGVTLSDEEAIGIQASRGVDLDSLGAQMTMRRMMFFDNNCGCGGGAGGANW